MKKIKLSLLKTISYRILGTSTTIVIAYSMGASIHLSSLIGLGELLFKPIIYFLHEILWSKFKIIKYIW